MWRNLDWNDFSYESETLAADSSWGITEEVSIATD